MTVYKYLFFDLDNTLWDFRANAHEAFQEVFFKMNLFSKIPDFNHFLEAYEKFNEHLWSEYRKGKLKKEVMREERMILTFKEMGIDDAELARRVSEIYLQTAPQKSNLFPEVHETLAYLKSRYKMYILTNGFAEVQIHKIRNSGLKEYFSKLFMAEMVGYQKPDKRFFEYAIGSIHAHKAECLMIGDDPEADIMGAAHAGINQVFFNPNQRSCSIRPTWEIKSFGELRKIL